MYILNLKVSDTQMVRGQGITGNIIKMDVFRPFTFNRFEL